ncbi:MAG: hypothetical protein RQ966_16955 [Acetobacteraceae bacterium]|nr:hypothetical protein [Acetobacteraceae bacterium]
MTILAARLFSPDLAVIWTDSECLSLVDGRHSRMRNKLVVAGAGVAVVSGGWADLGDEADRLVCRARDLDEAVRRLPELLRQRTMKMIRSVGRDARETARQIVFLAGFSPAAGRVMAYQFRGAWAYEAAIATAEAVPDVPEFHRLREPHPEHVECIARAQMDALRADYPEATGGLLTMATIRLGGIEARTLCDLAPERFEEPVMMEEAACTR